jgi:uncharacterized protein YaiE (UPF0345 family)
LNYFVFNIFKAPAKFTGTFYQRLLRKTLGFMLPGEYTFATGAKEIMEIMAGELEVLLPETEQWQSIDAGESFTVPGDAKFQIRIKTPTDYCCSYLA